MNLFYLFSAGNEPGQDRFCRHAEFLIERLCFIGNNRDSAYFLPAWTAKALLQEEAAKISGIAYVMETYVKDAKKILTE